MVVVIPRSSANELTPRWHLNPVCWTAAGRWRALVIGLAMLAAIVKLAMAFNTFGTNDVELWTEFADGVRAYGPVDIYGHQFTLQYNHAPLSGWFLVAVNRFLDVGVASVPVLIRVPAILADVVSAVLVFECVRHLRNARVAAFAGAMVACSPALFVISGFHGNTDPVFVMFALASFYCLAIRRAAMLAGVFFTLAISVKLVPIVLLPVLLVIAMRGGKRPLMAFLAGSGVPFLVLWGPVVLTKWMEFKENVLDYAGTWPPQWGLMKLGIRLGLPEHMMAFISGPGRFFILLFCALVPAGLLWLRPHALGPAAGLTFAMFLLLSPAIAPQYMVWPVAFAYLYSTFAATAYNLLAGAFLVVVYNRWNGGLPPWEWNVGGASAFTPSEERFALLLWTSLALVVLVGLTKLVWSPAAQPLRVGRAKNEGAEAFGGTAAISA